MVAFTITIYLVPEINPVNVAEVVVKDAGVTGDPFKVITNEVAFAPPDHDTVNPEDVIEEIVTPVGADGAGRGGPVVVALNDVEEEEPPVLTAVTIIEYAVLTVNPVNVADEEVEEEGVEAEPFKVYV